MQRRLSARRRTIMGLLSAFLLLLWGAPSSAAQPAPYPAKPVRVIVGFAPGGATDIVARTVSEHLVTTLGQPIVVDNRPGASGAISLNLGAQAVPDGYTIVFISAASAVSSMLQKRIPFDLRQAFVPVSQLAYTYFILLASPALNVKSMSELIAVADKRPKGLTVSSSGFGSMGHVGLESLKHLVKAKMIHVPYKGNGPALIDMMSGQVDIGFVTPIAAGSHVLNGRLRGLAVTSPQRIKALPDVPTMSESGHPDFQLNNWYGLAVPSRTSPAIVSLLHMRIRAALGDTNVSTRLVQNGLVPAPLHTPQDAAALLAREIARWETLMRNPEFADSLRK